MVGAAEGVLRNIWREVPWPRWRPWAWTRLRRSPPPRRPHRRLWTCSPIAWRSGWPASCSWSRWTVRRREQTWHARSWRLRSCPLAGCPCSKLASAGSPCSELASGRRPWSVLLHCKPQCCNTNTECCCCIILDTPYDIIRQWDDHNYHEIKNGRATSR